MWMWVVLKCMSVRQKEGAEMSHIKADGFWFGLTAFDFEEGDHLIV